MSTIQEINQQIIYYTRECVKKELLTSKIEDKEEFIKKIFHFHNLSDYNFANFIPNTTDYQLLGIITEEFNRHMTNKYGYPHVIHNGGWRDKCKIYTISDLYTYYAYSVSLEYLKEEIKEEIKLPFI